MKKSAKTSVLDWCRGTARDLGPLRLTLLFLTALILIFMPAPGTRAVYHGAPLVTTVLVPVLAPLLFMLLTLDALMARVFMTDTAGARRAHFRKVITINLLAAAALMLRWLPYFAALKV